MSEAFAPPAAELDAVRPTRIEVDLDRLSANLAAIRKHVGAAVMPILKANAYGHGLVVVAQHLENAGADAFGVAVVEEGVSLRQAGVQAPILVLGAVAEGQIAICARHDLTVTAPSIEKLRQLERVAAAEGRRLAVHLKVDTGMERIGVHWYSADAFLQEAARARNLEIEGLYSHLATADEPDRAFTELQISRFHQVRERFVDHFGRRPRWSHLANSGAILQHPEATFDLVRPGLLLYGVYPTPTIPRTVSVTPALRWSTRVIYFKVVKAGNPVGYGATWTPEVDTRVITLPVGYGDGYVRRMGGSARVLLGGRSYPVVGRICMDQMLVDIGRDSAFNGDRVVLLGDSGDQRIGAEDLAVWADTIPWEILANLSVRVPRIYHGGSG
jgi:alanine racemase